MTPLDIAKHEFNLTREVRNAILTPLFEARAKVDRLQYTLDRVTLLPDGLVTYEAIEMIRQQRIDAEIVFDCIANQFVSDHDAVEQARARCAKADAEQQNKVVQLTGRSPQ